MLTVDFTPPQRPRQAWTVLECPGCTCRFYQDPRIADYGADEMLTRGRAALYLQQGAGLAQLLRPLAARGRPAGTRLLDIGCGFGFGLDFAGRALGWIGLGMDPAGIAAMGRSQLGVDIEPRLLRRHEAELQGRFDVVMAAETLEHVASPPEFLAILKAALAPGGVLVLTTPDAQAITPQTPPGQLAGLLSPGLHTVLQTAASLRQLLTRAGFADVSIESDAGALVATAAISRLPQQSPAAAFGPVFLDHLEARARDFSPRDDLFWGLAGRAFAEAVHASDLGRADRLRPRLHTAAASRFGIDLDRPHLPAGTAGCSLERMADLVPLNLAAILHADAMRHLAHGALRPSQRPRLEIAAAAARALVRASGELGMAEPLSEELAWVAAAEALLCAAADAEVGDIVEGLTTLPQAPGAIPGAPPNRRDAIVARAFVALVNAARYATARSLRDANPALAEPAGRLGLDAVFCRAVLDLQPGGDAAAAAAGFAWVCDNGPPASPLHAAALQGLTQAQLTETQPAQTQSAGQD